MTIEELLKNVGVSEDVIEKVTSGMKETKSILPVKKTLIFAMES